MGEKPVGSVIFDFFDHDGAIFRRPRDGGGVTHVFDGNKREWSEYKGKDRTKPWYYGDRCADPLGEA